ncbi:unnamed protein product [Sphagnum troendelagicum]|uniref:Uncharacterized protein n=1 Tax=Sphagnum troendelagicum TaxID=128251 RepID=A0ABP0U2Q4_9BRYO
MNSGVGEKDFSQGSQPSSSGTSSKPSKRRMFAHSSMALETYVTTYKRLTKGNGNNNNNNNIVQSSLDPELFSLCGLLSTLKMHGIATSNFRNKRDILASMVGMELFCPLRSTAGSENIVPEALEEEEVMEDLLALGWLERHHAVDDAASSDPTQGCYSQFE